MTPSYGLLDPRRRKLLFPHWVSVTHWFVFDCGAGDTQVQLAILLDAGIDQSLNGGLFLEEKKGVA